MRGLLMTEPSVLGLLHGSKTQTRRLAKDRAKPLYKSGETLYVKEAWWRGVWNEEHHYNDETGASRTSISIVWGRGPEDRAESVAYQADGPPPSNFCEAWDKVTPLYMPAWAARLHITISDVRRQNLLDITEDDAHAEGIDEYHGLLEDADICAMAKAIGGMATDARTWYLTAWEDMHKRDRAKVRLEVGDPRYTTDKPWTTVRDYDALVAANPVVDAYTFTVTKL